MVSTLTLSGNAKELSLQNKSEPWSPEVPSMCSIPYARIPPNAPAMVAELKKIPFRRACSFFVYHNENKYTTPGKRPHSATPKKNRAAMRPDAVLAAAIDMVIVPHTTMINDIHRLGPTSFKQMLDGTSKMMYLKQKKVQGSGAPKAGVRLLSSNIVEKVQDRACEVSFLPKEKDGQRPTEFIRCETKVLHDTGDLGVSLYKAIRVSFLIIR